MTDATFEALFQQAPCGYVTTGDDGRITRVNDTFLAWSGHRREDLLGSAFWRLLPVGGRILWSTYSVPQLGTAGAVSEVVVEVVGADHARRPALVTATRSPGRGGAEAEVRLIVFSAPSGVRTSASSSPPCTAPRSPRTVARARKLRAVDVRCRTR